MVFQRQGNEEIVFPQFLILYPFCANLTWLCVIGWRGYIPRFSVFSLKVYLILLQRWVEDAIVILMHVLSPPT